MSSKFRSHSHLSYAVALALCTGLSSHAQSAENVLEEIVVTAQFTRQDLQETPLAITAVDANMMEARSQYNVEALAQRAPSVQFTAGGQGGGAQTAAVNIRGIGSSDFQFPNEPGVGVYIDDVYYGISFGTAFDLVDLERVEILRGPQGTLSGKNSIGGSIKLFSRKPTDSPDAYVEGTYGSFDRTDIKAASNFTLIPDRLYVRVTGVNRSVDGYLKRLDYGCVHDTDAPGGIFGQKPDGCVIGTEGGQQVAAARLALRYIASDRIENNLIADTTRDRSEASPAKSIVLDTFGGRNYITGPKSYTNYANYTGYPDTSNQYTLRAISQLDSWGVSNTLDMELSDTLALQSITAYRYASGASSWDGDNSPEAISNNYNTFEHRQLTQELRLSASFGEHVDATLGAYYYDAESKQGGRVNVGIAGLDFVSNDPFDQTSKSVFLHTVWHATDALNLTAGVRYTEEEKQYTFSRTSPLPGVPTDARVASLDGLAAVFAGSRTDYRLAIDYEVLPNIRPYAQVATGFKGGGINPRPYLEQQVVPFAQERSTSYEAGIKTMLFNRKLRLNAAYFHNDYEDYQGQVSSCPDISPPGFPFCTATRNVGDAKIDGVEVEFESKFTDSLSIDGSVSYVDFRFKSGLAGSGIVPGTTQAVFVPEWKYSLGAQYEFLAGNAGSITPRLDWTWQSEMQSNIPNNVAGFTVGEVESRGLLNARVTYRDTQENWQVSLALTNALDKFYYSNKYDRISQSGNAYGLPGRPREWSLTIKRSF